MAGRSNFDKQLGYLVSIGFQIDDAQLKQEMSQLDKLTQKQAKDNLQKFAHFFSSMQTLLKKQQIDISDYTKNMSLSLSDISTGTGAGDILKLFRTLNSELTKIAKFTGYTIDSITDKMVQLSKACTPMARELQQFFPDLLMNDTKTRRKTKPVTYQVDYELSQYGKQRGFTSVEDAFDAQDYETSISGEAFGQNKVTKEIYKNAVGQYARQLAETADAEMNTLIAKLNSNSSDVIDILQQNTQAFSETFDNNGNLTKIWIKTKLDDYTSYLVGIKRVVQEINGVKRSFFVREGGGKVTDNTEVGAEKDYAYNINEQLKVTQKIADAQRKQQYNTATSLKNNELADLQAKQQLLESSIKDQDFLLAQKKKLANLEERIKATQDDDDALAYLQAQNAEVSKLNQLYEKRLALEDKIAGLKNKGKIAESEALKNNSLKNINDEIDATKQLIVDKQSVADIEKEYNRLSSEHNSIRQGKETDERNNALLKEFNNSLQKEYDLKLQINKTSKTDDKTRQDLDAKLRAQKRYTDSLKQSASQNITLLQQMADAEVNNNKKVIDSLNTIRAKQQDANDATQRKSMFGDISETIKQLQQVSIQIEKIKNDKNVEGTGYIQSLNVTIDELKNKLASYGIAVTGTDNQINSSFSNTLLKLDKNSEEYQKLIKLVEQYNQAIGNRKAEQDFERDNQLINEAIKAKQELTRAELQYDKLVKAKASQKALREQAQVIQELQLKLEKLEQAELSFSTTQNGVKTKVYETTRYTEEGAKANEEYADSLRQIEAGSDGARFGMAQVANQFKKIIDHVIQYQVAFQMMNLGKKAVYSAVQTIHELDTAMTNIQMVTNQTDAEIRETISVYADLAKQLGATTIEVAEGSVEWLRQGRTAEETAELLQSSTMLSKIGMIDSAEATELMTSTLNGFKLNAEDAMQVVDSLSAVDLVAATSSQELATSLKYVASSAEMAGIGFDKMLGLLAVGSEKTRLSAETIGQA